MHALTPRRSPQFPKLRIPYPVVKARENVARGLGLLRRGTHSQRKTQQHHCNAASQKNGECSLSF